MFISHDARDAELAEAFGKLLKSVSAGMIKTFISSAKKGTEGIDFGEEWYKQLMSTLQSTSDVVCLFTAGGAYMPLFGMYANIPILFAPPTNRRHHKTMSAPPAPDHISSA